MIKPFLANLLTTTVEASYLPWPIPNNYYYVVFEVEHIGPRYDDTPAYTIIHAHEDVKAVFAEVDFLQLIGEQDTPIASGKYSAVLKYWVAPYTDWETGNREDDFGFDLHNLKRL